MNIDDYYEQKGSGDPIVFIHGSYATTSTWKALVEALSVNHHCICIKLPGHNGMPDPDDFANPSIETELSIVEQVTTKLTNKPIHLVGHSYGGVVALSQAIKKSLNICQLSLFEPVSSWVLEAAGDVEMTSRVQTFTAKYRDDAINSLPSVCGQVIDFWCGSNTYQALPDFVKQSMAPLVKNNLRHWDIGDALTHTLKDLHKMEIQTQIICGSESNPVAHAIAKHLHANLSNSHVHTINGANHFLVTTHPNECLKALIN